MTAAVAFASRKEAAIELGFSRQRLEKLIKQGRIPETSDGVDMAAARRVRQEMIALRPSAERETKPSGKKPYSVPRGAVETKDEETGELFSFADARARRENTNAKLAELKLASEQKRVILRDEVRDKEAAVARVVRDRILGFPARLANLIPSDAMKLLTEECEQLVRELQEAASKIAEG